MANHLSKNPIIILFLLLTTFSSLQYLSVHSFEFEVGGNKGWVVPPANDSKIYNDWASENRFQVGDTIRFKYKKDSVMEVIEQDYKKCNSSHPNFFSNTGNSAFKLDRSGSFYFISGVSGHCEKGQRMIIKVISNNGESPPSTDDHYKSSASPTAVLVLSVTKLAIVQYVLLSTVASYFC